MNATYEGLGTFYLGREVHPETGTLTTAPVLYDAADLTTHAFVVGMTGSGKTGLGIGLIEEAALDGVPVIAIDPKGDLGNLLLTFPDLAPADFAPWVDPAEATREGIGTDELSARKAALWREELAQWDQQPERIRRLRDAADFALYTPGSDAGLGLSVLGALDPPPDAPGSEAFGERVDAAVASLLSLLGVEADPLVSPEHVFLARVIADAWDAGTSLGVPDLIGALLEPPFETLGVMDVEQFYPLRQRRALAMKLNGLVASPAFTAWTRGEPLDAGRLFYGPTGRPRVSVLSIAHLDDAERLFFVTKLLGEVIAWMRRQPGTGSLRALLYMDEIFGFLPPSANPPTKRLFLTLLKQARAFGLGVVLATQNPVDMDYKALANCGTWFVGRLQTERDKARLLDGLEGASQAGFDRGRMDAILSSVGKRRFLLHNVHENAPMLFGTRWVMSYLAGPMTREGIASLMADRKAATQETAAEGAEPTASAEPARTPSGAPAASVAAGPPDLDLPQVFSAEACDGDTLCPAVLAEIEVPYTSARHGGVDATRRYVLLARLGEDAPDWSAAQRLGERPETVAAAPEGVAFAPLPEGVAPKPPVRKWETALKRHVQRERPLVLLKCAPLDAVSTPGEDERAFRIRVQQLAREARDAEKDALRARYAKRMDTLLRRIHQAEDRVEREAAQASQRKTDTVVRVGMGLLNAFMGRGRSAITGLGTTARSASRARKESLDVERAQKHLDDLQADYADLDRELTFALDDIDIAASPATEPFDEVVIKAKQSAMTIHDLAVVWLPE